MAKKKMNDKKLQTTDNMNNNPENTQSQGELETVQETVQSDTDAVQETAQSDTDAVQEPAQSDSDAAQETVQSDSDAVKESVQSDTDVAQETAQSDTDAAQETAKSDDAVQTDDAAEEVVKSSKEIRKEREDLKKAVQEQRIEMRNRNRAIRKMRKEESRQKYTELKNSVIEAGNNFASGAKEMSEDLKKLLTKDLASLERWKKTRPAEILGIFAKHNFYMGGFTPVELRTTLEDLGPTYVKIGQIMSSRVDMLPESYCEELELLRQNVKPLDPALARAVIEQETGKKIDEIFSEFDDDPIGSASIGQVHGAVLLDGSKVVVKVQRPLIADMMRGDFVLLKKIASAVKTVNEGKEGDEEQLDLMSVIEELEKVTNEELDFRVEAKNTIFFKENCIEDETKISCPTIYQELTTERIMTMSFVDGYSISKRDKLIADGYDPNEIGGVIVDNYLHQVLDIGTFHADPHQGNIMVCHGIPYWIDFGMIGRLTEANIKMIQDLILSIIQTDTDALVNAAMAMGAASPKTDRSKLTEDLDALIGRYMSVTNLDELDTAALLEDVTDVMSSNHIKIPGEYTMLIRSIATIEGVIEQLCPELNLFKMITDKLLARAKNSFNLQQSLIDFGKEAVGLSKKTARIPVLASDALNSIVKGRAKINLELTGYQELMNQVSYMVKYAVMALFSCIIFFGSCILCMTDIRPQLTDGIPLVAVAGFAFSIALGVYTVRKLTKPDKE